MRLAMLASMLVPALAVAGPKPLAASKHTPRVALDPTSVWLQLEGQNHNGYVAQAAFRVYGATSESDRLRLDWRQGSKVVGTASCRNDYDSETKTLEGECRLEDPIKAKGAVEVDLIYADDQAEKDYLVATLKLDVREWKSMGKSVEWGYVPDDLLALGAVRFSRAGSHPKVPLFEFWTTANMGQKTAQFHCTVDGKKLPDFKARFDTRTGTEAHPEITHWWNTDSSRKAYSFFHYGVAPGFRFGSTDDFHMPENQRWLKDDPGAWECALRLEGKTFRTFSFTVTKDGMIAPSELQSGAWALELPDFPDNHVVLVDMKIPKDNGYEVRLRQDALKRSIGWGLPWPSHPKVKAAQSAMPPSMGAD